VFISYSTADDVFARAIHRSLQKSGVRCWFAPHDMSRGRKLQEQIESAILVHESLLLIGACEPEYSFPSHRKRPV